jgi:hypothetical protein
MLLFVAATAIIIFFWEVAKKAYKEYVTLPAEARRQQDEINDNRWNRQCMQMHDLERGLAATASQVFGIPYSKIYFPNGVHAIDIDPIMLEHNKLYVVKNMKEATLNETGSKTGHETGSKKGPNPKHRKGNERNPGGQAN